MNRRTKTKRGLVLFPLVLIAIGTLTWAQTSRPFWRPAPETRSQAKAMIHLMSQTYTENQLKLGVYVGSEFCLACHEEHDNDLGDWRDTKHAYFIRQPMARYTLQP